MTYRNVHGLKRTIDAKTKRKIRLNSRFGCVICACFIVDYEHVDPEFADARQHDPKRMTLLCKICHTKKGDGEISVPEVFAAMKSPAATGLGWSKDCKTPLSQRMPDVIIAGTRFKNTRVVAHVMGKDVFRIDPPESKTAPYRISGEFYDANNKLCLKIVNNEWRFMADNWDFERVGSLMTIRRAKRKVSLRARFESGLVTIERLEMEFRGARFLARENSVELTRPNGGTMILNGCSSKGNNYGIVITEKKCSFGSKGVD